MSSKSEIHLARVVGGIVEIMQAGEYYPADDVLMLNQGEADSDGIVIIDGLVKRYMTNTQLDTAYLLNQLLDVVEQAINVADSSAYLIGANTPVFGKITAFAPITTALNEIKTSLEGHKLL